MSRSEANQIARDGRPLNVALTDAGPTPAKLWISPPARAAFPSCERIWTISTERPFSSKIFHLTAANSGTQQRELLGKMCEEKVLSVELVQIRSLRRFST